MPSRHQKTNNGGCSDSRQAIRRRHQADDARCIIVVAHHQWNDRDLGILGCDDHNAEQRDQNHDGNWSEVPRQVESGSQRNEKSLTRERQQQNSPRADMVNDCAERYSEEKKRNGSQSVEDPKLPGCQPQGRDSHHHDGEIKNLTTRRVREV